MTNQSTRTQSTLHSPTPSEWWLGATDAVTMATAHAAAVAEQLHLSIADQSFRVLNAVPAVNLVSRPVHGLHHGIARFCYQSVGLASVGLSRLVRWVRPDSFG
ncbi:MAG: hypothetical protein AAGH65_06795 [Pseudomonadota bacterium]